MIKKSVIFSYVVHNNVNIIKRLIASQIKVKYFPRSTEITYGAGGMHVNV